MGAVGADGADEIPDPCRLYAHQQQTAGETVLSSPHAERECLFVGAGYAGGHCTLSVGSILARACGGSKSGEHAECILDRFSGQAYRVRSRAGKRGEEGAFAGCFCFDREAAAWALSCYDKDRLYGCG